MKIQHILLTTDLSEEALRAFQPVQELAKLHGARITVFHMVPELRAVPHGAPLAPPIDPPDLSSVVEEARNRLDDQLSHLDSDVEVKGVVVVGESVWKEVAKFVEENGVDLIALSSHGRSGFRRLVLGSVAETILRHSHVPVLVFPRQD